LSKSVFVYNNTWRDECVVFDDKLENLSFDGVYFQKHVQLLILSRIRVFFYNEYASESWREIDDNIHSYG
jgi:hypothetical protein